MARARKQDASSSAVCAKSGAYGVISRGEDLNILNHQFSLGSAAETLQRKGTVEAFTCVGGSSWSGPPAVGLRASLCGACLCSVNGLQAPSCLCLPVVSFSNYIFGGKELKERKSSFWPFLREGRLRS